MIIGIFDNEFVKCELDDSLPVLRHRWKFELPGEEFRNNLMRVLEEYETLKKTYARLAWLADTTHLGEIDEGVDEWLVNVWEDLLFRKAGVKIHAVILGASIFADYPMEKFKLDAEDKFMAYNVHLGVFSNEKEAYDWIKLNQLNL
ncbi:MAG TPA: hypothetical protein VK517_03765 [Cyclobacteriaceae bacterium]|nr:hypothetical protein [Cyclobacteriaceae bacterium]